MIQLNLNNKVHILKKANKNNIPTILLQHGIYNIPSWEKYKHLQPYIPSLHSKMIVWGESAKNEIKGIGGDGNRIYALGSTLHDPYFLELKKIFPEKKLEIFSSDTLEKNKNIDKLLKKVEKKDIDILIGTQLLSKGFHFPRLNCIVVVDGDFSSHGYDLRAAEKNIQLYYQLTGRAGREGNKSTIYFQTYCAKCCTVHFVSCIWYHRCYQIWYHARDPGRGRGPLGPL